MQIRGLTSCFVASTAGLWPRGIPIVLPNVKRPNAKRAPSKQKQEITIELRLQFLENPATAADVKKNCVTIAILPNEKFERKLQSSCCFRSMHLWILALVVLSLCLGLAADEALCLGKGLRHGRHTTFLWHTRLLRFPPCSTFDASSLSQLHCRMAAKPHKNTSHCVCSFERW